MLVVFPLGLLATGVIFDFVRLLGGSTTFAAVAYWMIAAGLITGAAAAVFGWADWLGLPDDSRVKRLGLTHGIVNSIVLLMYAASLYVRTTDPGEPQIAAAVFSTVGAGFGLIGSLLGGELMDRLGAGVHNSTGMGPMEALSVTRVVTTRNMAPRRS